MSVYTWICSKNALLVLFLLLVPQRRVDQVDARPTIDDAAPVEPPTPGLIQLDDASFVGITTELASSYDFILLEFYSHWCPACKAFQPTYKEIAMHMKTIMDEEEVAWGARGVAPQSVSRPARVAVARIDCPENMALCDTFQIRKYPTIYVDRPMVFGSKAADSESRAEVDVKPRTKEEVLKRVGEIVGRAVNGAVLPEGYVRDSVVDIDGQNKGVEANASGWSTPKNVTRSYTDCDVKGDVTIATIEMFEYLKSRTVLSSMAARSALVDWLGLLEVAHLVEDCAAGAGEALRVLESSWPSSSEEIVDLEAFKRVSICGKEQKRPYVSCAGSTPETRGYTCGLWMLFHSLSVRMPEGLEGMNDGARWLGIVKGYIQHFFQCADCAEHFLQELNRVEANEVRSKRDAVLWLWRTHNRVNERLKSEVAAGTNSQDPMYPHIQWPSKEICAGCYDADGTWNEEAVAEFLFGQYYGTGSSVLHGTTELGGGGMVTRKKGTSWFQTFTVIFIVVGLVYTGLKKNNVQYGRLGRGAGYRKVRSERAGLLS